MSKTTKERAKQIIRKINLDLYLKATTPTRISEKEKIEKTLARALAGIVQDPENVRLHEKNSLLFIKALLDKYDLGEMKNLLDLFARMEPTMLSLGGGT